MSDYKTFAIWGAGNLGTRIANHLLAFKATVIILTRPVRQRLPLALVVSTHPSIRSLPPTLGTWS
jgi:phosphoglycerate dehydrogenase-like enzyme